MTNVIPLTRLGHCACGVPVADHFGARNEKLDCVRARRRWQDRLAVEQSHRDLLVNVIATVACVRLGRTMATASAIETLDEHQQQDVRLLAEMVLTMLDQDRVRIARGRAIDRGLDELRQSLGQATLHPKTASQFSNILRGAITAFTQSLNGLNPITDVDLARARELTRLPATSAVRRALESAQAGEGEVRS